MGAQKLRMKYHPAKKEIVFQRFQNGKEVKIRNDSRLMQYMNMKGKFVLQDFGNSFFDDIARAFDKVKVLDIEVITTKLDYEDFLQMVEYYNENSQCRMEPTLFAELPDMNQTFFEVLKHGEDSMGILQAHRQKLFEIPLGNENVKKCAENFAKQIDEEVKSIKEKIDDLHDNHVSLCFTGVYSAGKSALINAIIGYRILPESISSETAKMFRISTPREGEAVKIIFDITNEYTELHWNDQINGFEFVKGPSENSARAEIQSIINKVKEEGMRQHEQIKELLKKLNTYETVSSLIQIKFPVPLDNRSVQFTIYDTPGTDSNYLAHQKVLVEALEKQSQSILIFVAKPDGLEGSGNKALLNYLKENENKSSKTSIDIGRSLFVINKADGQTDDARKTLQKQEIKNEEDDFSIKLSDKKLFFTSAIYAYAAKAVANKVDSTEERSLFETGKCLSAIEGYPMGFCYRQNQCATSEVATRGMLEKCEEALKQAKKEEDSVKILEIYSGIYALENEIRQYGEKYASAVKAFAIIDSVDKALSKLSRQANSLWDSNMEDIHVIEQNIKELKTTIIQTIGEEYDRMVIPQGAKLPDEVRRELMIDETTMQNDIVGSMRDFLNRTIRRDPLRGGKARFEEKDREKIVGKIEKCIDGYTRSFLNKRRELLQRQQDNFRDVIKDTIENNGRISDSAKKVILTIPETQITIQETGQSLRKIYDSHKEAGKILWFKQNNLDKKSFMEDIENNLLKLANDMADSYKNDYCDSLNTLLTQIKSIYTEHLEQYSLGMKAMVVDRDAMKKLGERIADTASELEKCQGQLNEVIWRETGRNG